LTKIHSGLVQRVATNWRYQKERPRYGLNIGAINKSDPNVFDISLVTRTGDEKETIWLPAGTQEEDVMDEIEQLIGRFECSL
jgi:hypothetical protein